jgi:hypothetical protein
MGSGLDLHAKRASALPLGEAVRVAEPKTLICHWGNGRRRSGIHAAQVGRDQWALMGESL